MSGTAMCGLSVSAERLLLSVAAVVWLVRGTWAAVPVINGKLAEAIHLTCTKIQQQGPLYAGEDVSLDSCLDSMKIRALFVAGWMVLGLCASVFGYFRESRNSRLIMLLGVSALYLIGFYVIYLAPMPGLVEAYSIKFRLAVESGKWFEFVFFDLIYGAFFLACGVLGCASLLNAQRRKSR